jgi:hypothetical protein
VDFTGILKDFAEFDDYVIRDAIVSQIRRNMGFKSDDKCVIKSLVDRIIGSG